MLGSGLHIPVSMSLFNPAGFLQPTHRFRELLQAGADPNEFWRSVPGTAFDVRMPLLAAAKSRDGLAHLRLLLELPSTDLTVGDMQGATALHLAAANGDLEAMELLLGAGADHRLTDSAGRTPLHHACHTVDEAPMRRLLAAGADPNAAFDGRTALHETMSRWTSWPKPQETKVVLLLASGARINQRDRQGMTPLYYAACSGWARLTALLLKHGADPTLRANNGERPLDAVLRQVAVGPGRHESGWQETLAVLLDHDRKALLACVAQVSERVAMRRAM